MLVLLVLKGFFSGSEIALVNADKIKLRHRAKQGHRGAGKVMELFRRPEELLTTTLVGTNLSTVILTTLGTILMIELFGNELGDLYAFLIYTPLFLVLGEIVPKSIYQQKSDTLASIVVFPLRGFYWLFWPLVVVFSRTARLAAWMAGGRSTSQHLFISREQLRAVTEMAERAAEGDVFDRFRIERAIRFSDTTVGEEMVPIAEVVAINSNRSMADAMQIVRRRGFTCLPVYRNNISNVVGVVTLSTWDLLDPELAEQPLEELIRPVRYVSPYETLEELLPVLREQEGEMAIVVDEFGSAIGVITMEDVMEAVVGDFDVGWEFEERVPRHLRKYDVVSDGVYRMDGRLSISELNDVLGLDLPSTEFHTVGGMVLARLRHIPGEGESVVVDGYRFTVERATERKIQSVRVEREGFGG